MSKVSEETVAEQVMEGVAVRVQWEVLETLLAVGLPIAAADAYFAALLEAHA